MSSSASASSQSRAMCLLGCLIILSSQPSHAFTSMSSHGTYRTKTRTQLYIDPDDTPSPPQSVPNSDNNNDDDDASSPNSHAAELSDSSGTETSHTHNHGPLLVTIETTAVIPDAATVASVESTGRGNLREGQPVKINRRAIDGTDLSPRPPSAATATPATPTKPTTSTRRRRRTDPKKTNIETVKSPAEFNTLVRSEPSQIVVVRFHSNYCPACKSIKVSYDKLVNQLSSQIKFVDCEVVDRNDLIPYNLPNVNSTPYGMIYFPGIGVVEESPIPRRQFSKFKKILRWYLDGECEIPEEFFDNPHGAFDLENLIL